jgi:solute carrier family 40 (iron-regulated transporter), member 1
MLGVLRAVAGIAGISATYLMPMISSRIGVIRTGIWSLWAEFFTLVPVVLSFKLNTSHWIKFMMMFGGMSLSRIGLWMFDFATICRPQNHRWYAMCNFLIYYNSFLLSLYQIQKIFLFLQLFPY